MVDPVGEMLVKAPDWWSLKVMSAAPPTLTKSMPRIVS